MTDDGEDATTWRDLTDQLTREQIANLEKHERRGHYAVDLLEVARELAEQNMIEQIYSPEPLPPDSVGSIGWRVHNGRWSRYFETGSRYVVENAATFIAEIVDPHDPAVTWDEVSTRRREPVNFWVAFEIEGEQFTDGSVNRWISLLDYGPTEQAAEITAEGWPGLCEMEFSPDAVRRLAAALAQAADEVEKLA